MHGTAEADAEIHVLVTCPAAASAIAHQGIFVDGSHTSLPCVVAHRILQVDDDSRIVASAWEGEVIESHSLGGGHLCLDAEAVEQHPIIAGYSQFVFVAIGAGQSLA